MQIAPRYREAIALRVAELDQCEEALDRHTILGRRAGTTDEEIRLCRGGISNDLREQALLTLVTKIFKDHGRNAGFVLDLARDVGLSKAQIIEVITLVGCHSMSHTLSSFDRGNDRLGQGVGTMSKKALMAGAIVAVTLGAWDARSETMVAPVPVDQTEFDRLLRKHVSGGAVDYRGFQEDVAELDRYLAALAQVNLDGAPRERKLAFYINAYNACTVRLILRHLGSIESIRDIPRRWDTREWKLAGETLSLDDIEHKKLREELEEPRIHFAIVCASLSCPDLASRAYTEAGIDAELDEATKAFLRSPEHVRTEIKEGFFGTSYVLYLSRIFEWFGEDFTDDGRRTIPDFVARYANEKDASFIGEHEEELSVRYLDYDWSLNEKKTSP